MTFLFIKLREERSQTESLSYYGVIPNPLRLHLSVEIRGKARRIDEASL